MKFFEKLHIFENINNILENILYVAEYCCARLNGNSGDSVDHSHMGVERSNSRTGSVQLNSGYATAYRGTQASRARLRGSHRSAREFGYPILRALRQRGDRQVVVGEQSHGAQRYGQQCGRYGPADEGFGKIHVRLRLARLVGARRALLVGARTAKERLSSSDEVATSARR